MTEKIFKLAFSDVRDNSNEIYKGFGFKHLDDVTEYYVHPNNVSSDGHTALCQTISEAAALFTEFIYSFYTQKPFGEIFYDTLSDKYRLEILIPDDWKRKGVFDSDIAIYRVFFDGKNIKLAAYNQSDEMISGDVLNTEIGNLNKYFACFLVVLAKDYIDDDSEIRLDIDDLIRKPSKEPFVVLCEDFYQKHKNQGFEIYFYDVKYIPTDAMLRLSAKGLSVDAVIKSKVEIQHFSPELFSDYQLCLIPQLSEEFQLDESLRSVCNSISCGDTLSVLLHGPAGTGKTMSCKLICSEIGLPLMETINCTENLDEFVLGKYIPDGEKIIFVESYVTKAIRDGGAVVFEEINFAKPQYLAFLNSLLDDNGFVRLDNGEVVRRNKNFRFFATMNVGYFGTKQLNQALYNRFNVIVEIATLSDYAIERMLVFRVPECEKYVSKVLGVYHKIKKQIETEELDIVISPRNLENWVRLAKYEDYVSAAERTIIPVAKGDKVLEDNFRALIKVFKWD